MQSIYLGKQSRSHYKINLKINKYQKQNTKGKNQSKTFSSRPWSSKLGYQRKIPTINKPQSIFSLIKRDNILNLNENQNKMQKSTLLSKKIRNQVNKAVTIDNKNHSNKLIHQKLYVSKKFQIVENQLQSQFGSSCRTNTFNSFDSNSNLKVSLLKNLNDNRKQQAKIELNQKKNLLTITQKQQESYRNRKSHRKSYFLDQMLANQIRSEFAKQENQDNLQNGSKKNDSSINSFSIQSVNFKNLKSEKKNAQIMKEQQNEQSKNFDEIHQNKGIQQQIKISPPSSSVNLPRKRSNSRRSSIFSLQKQKQIRQLQIQTNQIAVQTSQLQIFVPPQKAIFQEQLKKNTILDNQLNQSPSFKSDFYRKSQKDGSNLNQSNNSGSAKIFYEKMHPQTQYREALIIKKFCQQQKNYQVKYVNNVFKLPNYHHSFDFQIKCLEIHKKHQIVSLKDAYSTKKLSLFPKIFKQICNYSTTLSQVVNILLKFNPLTIYRLFNNNSIIHPAGLYSVWLYHQQINMFKPVFINDQLPFFVLDNESQQKNQKSQIIQPVYGKIQTENSIWFMILEKAIAKIVGGYYQLSELTTGDLFRILTGSPVVNLKNFTPLKLKKMLKQKIFQNKKAYVYALTNKNDSNLKLDRIINVNIDQFDIKNSSIQFQNKEWGKNEIKMYNFIQNYSQICLLFFSINFVYNQLCLPTCKKHSQLLQLYLINQNDAKNTVFITLGGFNKNDLKSKISIYRQVQDDQNPLLSNLEVTDPLTFYQSKYEYIGQISQNGNYFFQTKLSFGKFLCLIQAKFQINAKYYISIYSQKQIKIDQPYHNQEYIPNSSNNDGIQKLMHSNLVRKNIKNSKSYPEKLLTKKFVDNSDQQEIFNPKQKFKKRNDSKINYSQDSNQQNFYLQTTKSVKNWMKQRRFVDDNFQLKQLKKMQYDQHQIHKMKQKRKKQKQKKQAQLQEMKNQKKHMLLNIITKISSPVNKEEIAKKIYKSPSFYEQDQENQDGEQIQREM